MSKNKFAYQVYFSIFLHKLVNLPLDVVKTADYNRLQKTTADSSGQAALVVGEGGQYMTITVFKPVRAKDWAEASRQLLLLAKLRGEEVGK